MWCHDGATDRIKFEHTYCEYQDLNPRYGGYYFMHNKVHKIAFGQVLD